MAFLVRAILASIVLALAWPASSKRILKAHKIQRSPRSVCKALGFLYGTMNKRNGHCNPVVSKLMAAGWKPPGKWFRGLDKTVDPLISLLVSSTYCDTDRSDSIMDDCPGLTAEARRVIQKAQALKDSLPKYDVPFSYIINKTNGSFKESELAKKIPKEPTLKNAQLASPKQIVNYITSLATWFDEHPRKFDQTSFETEAADYARFGHELNKVLVEGYGVADVESERGAGMETIYLGSFFRDLVKAIHPLPPYSGTRVFRDGYGYLPFTDTKIEGEIGTVFQVHQFLSTTKKNITAQTPIAIDPKPNGWFRDISTNRMDRGMDEVLGIMGLSLKYISAPSETLPYHLFEEV